MSVCSVYVVFPDVAEAMHIGRLMVEERLSACFTVFGPCTSIYWWKGTVEQSDETPALFKTTTARVDGLIERVAELHSYETPAIVVWPIERLHAAYGDWVESEVR